MKLETVGETYTVDGSGIRVTMVNSPVEVGKFIQLLKGFDTSQVVFSLDF